LGLARIGFNWIVQEDNASIQVQSWEPYKNLGLSVTATKCNSSSADYAS
jgi:hypothetical protein